MHDITTLKQPGNKRVIEPARIPPISLLRRRNRQELGLVAVDRVLARPDIRLRGRNTFGLGDELVPEDHDQVQRDAEVRGDEVLVVELAVCLRVVHEDVVVLRERDEAAEHERDVRAGQAQGCDKGQGFDGDVLRAPGVDEVDVGDEKGDPGEQAEDGDEVDKVPEDGLGVVRDVHVREKTEGGGEPQGVDGDAAAVGFGEDLGGFAFSGEAVQGSGGDVQVGVGRGEDEEQDGAVEDTREVRDAGQFDGDDEGRCGGGGGVSPAVKSKLLGVVGNQHAEKEDGEHVEDEDSVKGQLDGARDGLARVLRLSDGDTDKLGTQICKSGRYHCRPETEETTSITLFDVWFESTGLLPVSEPLPVLVGTASKGQDQGQQDETDDDDDLE